MEFIKNIRKPFILSPDFNIKKELRIKTQLDFGKVVLILDDLHMGGGTFKIKSIENGDQLVDEIINGMINDLTKSSEKAKKIARKVIKAWEKNPEAFIKQKKSHSSDIYINKGLLNDNDYHHHVWANFENLSYMYHDLGFSTGWGGDTHYAKSYYEEGILNLDKWTAKRIKEVKTSKIKKRITNYLYKIQIEFSFNQILKHLSVDNKTKIVKKRIPPFPVQLTGQIMNALLYAWDSGELEFDDEGIEIFNEEYGIDLTPLKDWEINTSHEGEHHNDGQMCDYTVEFQSPDGHSYYAYNTHCLMTGWNFSDGPIKL